MKIKNIWNHHLDIYVWWLEANSLPLPPEISCVFLLQGGITHLAAIVAVVVFSSRIGGLELWNPKVWKNKRETDTPSKTNSSHLKIGLPQKENSLPTFHF